MSISSYEQQEQWTVVVGQATRYQGVDVKLSSYITLGFNIYHTSLWLFLDHSLIMTTIYNHEQDIPFW